MSLIRNKRRFSIIIRINLEEMALVYRSRRFQNQKKRVDLGPAYYSPEKIKPHSHDHQHVFMLSSKQNTQQLVTVGPGQYESREGMGVNIVQKEHNAVFKSKVERFKKDSRQTTLEKKQQIIDPGFLIQKQNQAPHNYGKLRKPEQSVYHYNNHRIKKNSTYISSIPSIPCNEQSYGYRIDNQTSKLVLNQNPHILLANTITGFKDVKLLMEGLYNGPGSYFGSGGPLKKSKGLKWVQQKLNQKKQPEQKQTNNEQCVQYKSKWDNIGNALYSRSPKQISTFESIDKKQMIKLNGIKRKFERYFNQEEIDRVLREKSDLKKSAAMEKQAGSSFPQTKNNQCFMSKEKRMAASPIIKDIHQQRRSEREDSVQEKQEQKKKIVPFQVGSNRFPFQYNHMNRVGPATYNSHNIESRNNLGSYWSQQEHQPIKKETDQIPGPGSYCIETTTKKPKQTKNQHPVQRIIKKKSSLESEPIFTEFTRQKLAKQYQPHKIQGKRPPKSPILISDKAVIKQIKKVVMDTQVPGYIDDREQRRQLPFRPLLKSLPKQKQQINVGPGPGNYQIPKKKIRKTYNISYD